MNSSRMSTIALRALRMHSRPVRIAGNVNRLISTAAVAQLRVFPEFSPAAQQESTGNYALALPLYQRMHEVVATAMGPTSHIAVELTCHQARLFMKNGEFAKAIKLLASQDTTTSVSKVARVSYLNLLAEAQLLSGSTEEAYETALRSLDACEAHSEDTTASEVDELSLFSPTYGILGVCSLYHGDLDLAETYLQLAARWAQQQHPQHQIAALSNLGTFSIFKLGTAEYPLSAGMDAAKHGLPALRRQLSSVAASVNHKALLEHTLVRDAMNYWTEALAVVTTANAARKVNAAGAMCGVAPDATPDMTGLGGKARTVPNPALKPAPEEEGEGQAGVATPENLLHNVSTMSAYVNVLCNFAELYECTGSLADKDEYVSTALATLQTYEKHIAESASSSAGGSSAGDSSVHSEVAHRPVLGRVLTLAAHKELSMGQAVTAEGLYRSALGHLNSPAALHDPRYKYERGVLLSGYGLLLSKWDKRAPAGLEMTAQAQPLLDGAPSVRLPAADGAVGEISIPLSALVQLPR